MSDQLIIGVDPGLTTGIALLDLQDLSAELVQCTPGLVLAIVRDLPVPAVLAVERFVTGPRAARSSTAKAGQITRELVGQLTVIDEAGFLPVVLRSASEVKPWATDARLDAAGLLAPTKGMPHARDAVRHALYAAVRDCGVPDPLSRRGQ